MIAIVDYGAGNLRSVERALIACGARPKVTADPADLESAAGVVLPGVGAFGPALERLETAGLGRRLVEVARRGLPVLGVCLGYQLLFEESEEGGRHAGLGLLPGRVARLTGPRRVPVIGWCRVHRVGQSLLWNGLGDAAWLYFVHSYAPTGCTYAVASTDHAQAAAAEHGNVSGTQFHPEKSGADGLRVYANFLAVCGQG
jgi:imidazole glycerol-phosphate synthase subunit HisH